MPGKSVPEEPYLRNSHQAAPSENEGVKDFLKPRLPPPSSNGGKVSTKPSISDIPEGPDPTFEEFDDDIMTQYGSQKPEEDKTIMEAPPAESATNGGFDTFDDATACENAANAPPPLAGNCARPSIPLEEPEIGPPAPPVREAASKGDVTAMQDDKSTASNGTTTLAAGEESESQFDSQDSVVLEVFKNLRIAMLGFSDEEVGDMTEMIESSLGTVVTSTPTTLKGPEADYLIVPVQV